MQSTLKSKIGQKLAQVALAFGLLTSAAHAVDYQLDEVVTGLDRPWAMAFLPNGDMLVTELTGQLRIIRNNKLVAMPVAGVPASIFGGQGGLMDIVLHPDYSSNKLIYLSLSVGTPEAKTLRVIRARFTGDAIEDIQTVFEAAPKRDTYVHYGARLAFLADKTLLITNGDGFDYREEAQSLGNHYGAIVRVTDNGKVPADNPFVKDDAPLPEIWSYGHRNPQGILVDPQTGTVFETEHGPRGGDELNIIEPGQNYGWPIATYGLDYSGARVSPYTEYEGTKQPELHWTPSIAPSSMTLYRGSQFPEWDGDIFVSSLVFQNVTRVDMDGTKVIDQETLFAEIGARLRSINTGPDGALYILTEGEIGKLWRVSAK